MKINFPFILFCFFGILTAISAALFFTSTRLNNNEDIPPSPLSGQGSNILVASNDLKAHALLTRDNITQKFVGKEKLPKQYFSEPEQIIGKNINIDMSEGQLFLGSSFPIEGYGAFLAAKLKPGMRAINIELSANQSMEGLIYPGALVDVLVSFEISNQSELLNAVSTTVLQNIEVLAVGNQIIGSVPKEEKDTPKNTYRKRDANVTLLLDAKQVEIMQLATEFGDIYISLRNPSDDSEVDNNPSVLSRGRLGKLDDILLDELDQDKTVDLSETPTVLEESREQSNEIAERVPAVPASKKEIDFRRAYVVKGLDFETREF
jgi:Flp pilus assembly protein CpaB